MAEIGVVLVGPDAARMRLELARDVPVLRVRGEEIVPLDDDVPAMVAYAADGTFHGADADRWRVLDAEHVREDTAVLWACAQVQAAGLHQATAGWEKVLLVAWSDEPGLVPATRAVVEGERPITVLLGGPLEGRAAAQGQANRAVLAHLVRQGQVTTVIWNPEPHEVLDVALDAARHPDPIRIPRGKPVDIGPLLDLPSTWCVPASPVHFFALVHVPMGYARRLPQLAVMVAAWRAIRDVVGGPPVDVSGATGGRSVEDARRRLPDPSIHLAVEERIRTALEAVRFEGEEPLVEQIDRLLRPVLAEVEQIVDAVADVERLRLRHLRTFSACGIHYTVQSLSSRLDALSDPYPHERLDQLRALLSGEGEAGSPQASVHVTAWRRTFSGLASRVARPGSPGWQLARSLVKGRFRLLVTELSSGVARHLEVLVKRALDPEAEASSLELRALRERAERVRDALADALEHLEQRIMVEADEAVSHDRFVRWGAGDGRTLFQSLLTRIGTTEVARALDKLALEVLSRRALGMAEDRDFELWLQDLAREVHKLPTSVVAPSYEQVLLLLLQGRDPPVLRQAIAQSQGAEVELHLERPVEPALMNWLTATGMLVVVAPRLKTCAIYWQRVEKLDLDVGERLRRATSEHRMSDLLLPAAGGDELAHLANLVRAAVYLMVGLVLGVFAATRLQEGMQVHVLVGRELGLPELVLLPHGGLHLLAHDDELLARLRSRIDERLAALSLAPDAADTVKKLVELAALGPSSTLAAQLGLYGARFEHLEHAIHALLQRCANLAVASMVDCLHTTELEQLVRPPRRRTLVDVLQLG